VFDKVMRDYKKIPIWENVKRVNFLIEFKNLIVKYFNNIRHADYSLDVVENEEAKKTRYEINIRVDKTLSFVLAAGVSPFITYAPPPVVGGYIEKINLILDIFHLYQHRIKPQEVLDVLDRVIGIYNDDKRNSLFRTFNPFFWLGLLLEFIVSLFFRFLGEIGFNQKKIENSVVGKIIKGILYIIEVFAAVLTILGLLGYLDEFRSWLQNLIK